MRGTRGNPVLPGTTLPKKGAWQTDAGQMGALDPSKPSIAYTGFYRWDIQDPNDATDMTVGPWYRTSTGSIYNVPVGARVLGQKVDDRFGNSAAADDRWLFIAAKNRTALAAEIQGLGSDRTNSGVVYMYNTFTPEGAGRPTRSQLWIEPAAAGQSPDSGRRYPQPDAEDPNSFDYTMPVPHQYIVKNLGSFRKAATPDCKRATSLGGSGDCFSTTGFPMYTADAVNGIGCTPYVDPNPVGTSAYNIQRVWQVVGPHNGARVNMVRTVGDH